MQLKRTTYLSIGILSASIIAFQLALMQLLATIQWSHFAYMVISVALLGFGASGTALAFTKTWFVKRKKRALPILMALCGLSMSLIMLFSSGLLGSFDSYLLFLNFSQAYSLVAIYFTFFVPFFLGAMAIGLVYAVHVQRVGSLYFSDLFGSGIGGLAMIGLCWFIYPVSLPALISILPVLGGLLILPREDYKKAFVPTLLALGLPLYLFLDPPVLPASQYKSISGAMNLPGAWIVDERPSPYGHVQVLRADALRYAPGLSLSFTGSIPVRDVIFANGEWFGPVIAWTRSDSSHFLNFTTNALPYITGKPRQVLVLDAGTGLYAAHALSQGAESVTQTEHNLVAVDLLKHELAGMIDSLFTLPGVNTVGIDSRSYLLQDKSKYDLIVLPTIETFGGTSGINALDQQYILTKEAFLEMWDRLTDNGMIAVTSWVDYPVRNPLRILATMCEVLEDKTELSVNSHLISVRSWGTISFVIKKTAFTEREIERIREFCQQMYFDPFLIPGIVPGERTTYNQLQDTSFFVFADRIVSGEREALYDEYDFNIRPASDNRPYFSQFLKLSRIPKLGNSFGNSSVPFLETGYIIVLVTFVQITLAAIILIVVPLFALRWKGQGKFYTVLHFSAIGIGFMFVEMILIQQFTLYFGNPIYAAAAALSALLICAGMGSLVSSNFNATRTNIVKVLALAIVLILLYKFLLTPLLMSTIGLPLIPKIIFSLLIIFPVAFFMGMPFPLGLRLIADKNEALIPWAWGINGCLSVISTILATIISVEAGFDWVMIIAAAAYGLVLMVNLFSNRN